VREAFFDRRSEGPAATRPKVRQTKPPASEVVTELRVAHELEHAMRRFGALRASFEPIVAAGPRAALPHARATGAPAQGGGFVLVDWGASDVSGYKSDLTRVLPTDKISPKLAKIYRVVLKAQRRGIESVRPGARCADIDAAARAVIVQAGFGKRFGHGLGHGIGLEIHEGPRLNPRSEDTLAPGMVITIEPGIYLPGWGGVRIEDDVLVTRDGFELLSTLPRELG
jgi:Xaa-Pro aminopeptidase